MASTAAAAAPSLKVWSPGSGSPLAVLLPRYALAHPDLRAVSLEQLQVIVNLVAAWGLSLDPPNDSVCCDEIFQLERFEAFVKWLFESPKKTGAAPGQPRALRTIKGKRDGLWTLWRFAKKRGFCDQAAPDREDLARLKCPKEDPVAWSPDEVREIIESARKAPPILWWTPAHWVSFLCAQWYSVERFQSLLSCRIEDLADGVLSVRARRTKDKKPGAHPIPVWLNAMIQTLPLLAGDRVPLEQRPLIWPFPFGPETMRSHLKSDILKPAGLPSDGKHLFHCIRRSGITEMVNVAGLAAAQELARHSSPAITIESYVSQAKLRRKSAADVLPNPSTRSAEQLALF